MNDDTKLLRRRLLKRAVVLAGASLTASVVPGKDALAQAKVSKETSKYQDKPSGDKQCSNCVQFIPNNGCKVVEGTISPQGYCMLWVKKS
jgi:hypothetical protein